MAGLTVGRRVLITGLGTFWGGRVAQALENDPAVDLIVGLDTTTPAVKLERTEYVRADQSYSILSRIVKATQVDTILHTSLAVDSTRMSGRALHETNVIGTMNLVAAAGAPDSPVRQLVVKSSTLVYGASHRDPAWFREDMARTSPAKTRVERSLLEVESYLQDFADESPDVTVAILRFANVLGTDIVTPITKALSLPMVPAIFGFDPLLQFVEEDDVVRSLEFAMRERLAGIYNVAGDGRLPWSEVAGVLGKRVVALPPFSPGMLLGPLARLGVLELPDEVAALLRFGRGVDNTRLTQAGFAYRYTTSGAVESFSKGHRLRRVVPPTRPEYAYQRDVEAFFRHSPAVVRPTS
ncbi:MAG TPA: NAD-dependent epimerase/dehydratase family protein [Acidimicrobiales bacterium]|nr:NAD-dependent epimerase/dehydratase family protein [Acidimicrobiales bacterium]